MSAYAVNSSIYFTIGAKQEPIWRFIGWNEWVTINVAYITVGIIGIGGNAFVLALFKKYPLLRKEDCVYLMAVLAVADFVGGAGYVVAGVALLNRSRDAIEMKPLPRWRCITTSFLAVLGLQMDQIVLLCIAFDRHEACKSSCSYMVKDHRRYAIKTLCFMCFAIPAVGASYLGSALTDIPEICTFGGSAPRSYAIIYSLWITFLVPTVLLLNIHMMWTAVYGRTATGIRSMSEVVEKRQRQRQMDVVKTMGTVSVIFAFFSGFPNIIFIICTLILGGSCGSIIFAKLSLVTLAEVERSLLARGTLYIALGGCVSVSVNVFIYAAKHRRLRHYMRQYLLELTFSGTKVTPIDQIN